MFASSHSSQILTIFIWDGLIQIIILRKHIKVHFLELGFIQVLASPVTNACIFTKLQLTTRNLKNSAIIYLLLRKKNPERG